MKTDVFFNTIYNPLRNINELTFIFLDMDEAVQRAKMIRYYNTSSGFFVINAPISSIIKFAKKTTLKKSNEFIE